MKERFIEFLKSQGVFEKFMDEFEKQNVMTLDMFMDEQSQPSEYLYWAFVWDETQDGHTFWEELDDKWVCEAE